jgi:DNA-binding CsgD family transcriptional regulator
MTISDKDLQALWGIVSSSRADIPTDGLPASLLGDLAGQVRCDFLTFTGTDSHRRDFWFGQEIPGGADDEAGEGFWEHYARSPMCSYPDRGGDLRSITMLSDFSSARQWHSTGMYSDVMRPLHVEDMLMLCLPAPFAVTSDPGRATGPGRTLRLIFYRGPGPGFTERDRALLALLRPHLHEAYADAERRRAGSPQLTTRHWELLRLIAAGHTNAQAARRLGITEGTVRTHLENIYGRLQVSSRTAAVTRAFPNQALV